MTDIAESIDEVETAIREAVPAARVIYIEPDIYRKPSDANPSTDLFVIRGLD
jgi:hypothetical protein